MGGVRTSATSELTILPKAPPMMTPTAISTTLPRIANSLNSWIRLMLCLLDERATGRHGTELSTLSFSSQSQNPIFEIARQRHAKAKILPRERVKKGQIGSVQRLSG